MKAKAMKLSYILPLLMMGGTTLFTGCEQGKDLYNPELVQEEAKKAFPVKDIDPNHTWETSALCNATVSVDEKAGDTYTIKVYTANPYNTNGNAALLATTTVADGKTANFKFDIPAALQQVYVMKVNGAGYSAAVPATVENGILKVEFGGKNATTTRTAMTRNAITRAESWVPEELPTKAPDGAIYLNAIGNQWNDVVENGNYIVNSQVDDVNVGKPVNLYIEGEVTLQRLQINKGWPKKEVKIYLLPNSRLTLKGESNTLNYWMGIAKSGELTGENLQLNQESFLYNCGKIEAEKIEITNNAQFYNGDKGKVHVEGAFKCTNGSNVVQNYGEVEAESFNLEGSSALYNYGEIDIDGHSEVNSNNCVWDNGGTFESETMAFNSTSPNWINRCKLIVDEKLECKFGDGAAGLIMDAESYAECGELYFTSATIKMGTNAYFNVKGNAVFGYSKDNQGFIGEGEKPALLQINSAINENGNYPSIRYDGKLYVACENHFSGKDSKFYQMNGDAKFSGADGAGITIPKSECNPGYGGTPDGGGNSDKVVAFAYGFEDMAREAGTDYDFNDVVLYVSVPYEKEGKKFVNVTLKAAGASKALSVHFYNIDNKEEKTIFEDVHTALEVSAGTLVNTGRAEGTEKTVSIEVSNNFNLTAHGDFYISDGRREVHIPAFTTVFNEGDVPYAVRVAGSGWEWPKESISIVEAYPGFEAWAKNKTQNTDWYNTPQEGKVMTNSK